MKKQHTFIGTLLIGIGVYFLLKELHISLLNNFYTWPTILMIIGVALLLDGYIAREKESIFSGTVILGIGIHIHGLMTYAHWIESWAIYVLILSIAFLLRAQQTKKGIIPGIILLIIALFSLFSNIKPGWFYWIDFTYKFIEDFWPLLLIGMGIYFLYFKRK